MHIHSKRDSKSDSRVVYGARITGLLAISLVAWFTLASCASAGDTERMTALETFKIQKDPFFKMMHDEFSRQSKEGKANLLFIGDSITFGWTAQGKAVWDREFAGWKTANFGVPGDTTAGVLWRITHGEVSGLNPKAIVLLIGTNDLTEGTLPTTIAENVGRIIDEFKKISPDARIVIVGVLPRGLGEQDSYRREIKVLNESLAKLDNGTDIRYLDFGAELLTPDKKVSEELLPDFLHLSDKGYEIWAKRLRPLLSDLTP